MTAPSRTGNPGIQPPLDPLLASARIHYRRSGSSGPRLVLIHPIGFDLHTWEELIDHLDDAYQVVSLDLPGHGQSDKPPEADYSLPSLGARVLRFLDELGWEDAAFVANSIGGGVSLAAALQAPERVRALVLANSVGFRWGLPFLGRLAAAPLVPSLSAYTPALAMRFGLDYARCGWGKVSDRRFRLCREYFRDAPGRHAFFRALQALYGPELDEMAPHYGEIPSPALVVHGAADPLIRVPHARRLAEAIPGANLKLLPRCGHFPQEESPDAFARTVRGFLDRVLREM